MKTSFKINQIGIGGNAFGYFNDQNETQKILYKSLNLNIKILDTSDTYSNGNSERYIGNILYNNNIRSNFLICSKCGLKPYEKADNKFTKLRIENKFFSSLKRLKTDYLDYYAIHNYDRSTPINEILSTLQSLAEKGYLLNYGISNVNYKQYLLLQKLKKKYYNLSYFQILHNLFNRDNEVILSNSKKNKDTIFTYGSLLRGILTGKYLDDNLDISKTRFNNSTKLREHLSEKMFKFLRDYKTLCNYFNIKMIHASIYYSIYNTSSSVLIGFRDSKQLTNLANGFDSKIENVFFYELNKLLKDHQNFKINYF